MDEFLLKDEARYAACQARMSTLVDRVQDMMKE
jgi:hypothetical protein